MSPAELYELRLLARKLHRVMEKRGAPMTVRRFLDDVERAITWHEDNKEKMK